MPTMRAARRPSSLIVAGLVLLTCDAALAKRPRPDPCPGGIFAVAGSLVTDATGTTVGGRVTLRGSEVTLDGLCPAVAAKVKARRKVTQVAAQWSECAGLSGGVRLTAKIAGDACDAMSGVLRLKKGKPRRRRFTARRLAAVGLVETLRDLDVQDRLRKASFPFQSRPSIERLYPEAALLIAGGPAVLDDVLAAFEGPPVSILDETPIAILAYVVERIGDRRAVPVLARWLERNRFATSIWATDFVTHAIKVLDGQGGRDDATFFYDLDAELATITQAAAGAARDALAAAGRIRPLVVDAASSRCTKRITVVGVNAGGQEETLGIEYGTIAEDINARIAELPAADPERTRLERSRQLKRSADEADYDGSGYRTIPGEDVSDAANCGGTVTERLLERVAARNGIPLTLGRGYTLANHIRDVARSFGETVSGQDLDVLTVIAHEETPGGNVSHVEIPIADAGDTLLVFSKDNQGYPRTHEIPKGNVALGSFAPVLEKYASSTPRFYRLDPARIRSISVDSSACPCAFRADAPLTITEPAGDRVGTRSPTLRGRTADGATGTGAVRATTRGLALEKAPPTPFPIRGGVFEAPVALEEGPNAVRVAVELADGRRGCVERTLEATGTPPTFDYGTIDGAFFNLCVARAHVEIREIDGSMRQDVWEFYCTTDQVPNFGSLPVPDPAVVAGNYCLIGKTPTSSVVFDPATAMLTGSRTEWEATFINDVYRSDWSATIDTARHHVTELRVGNCWGNTSPFDERSILVRNLPARPDYLVPDGVAFGLEGRAVCDAVDPAQLSIRQVRQATTSITRLECSDDPVRNVVTLSLHGR